MYEVSAFICQTPLQSVIAGKIIREQRITDYVLMNINSHDAPVTRNYFAKIAQGAIESEYIVANSRIFGNYQKISGVLKSWGKYRITSIYLATISNVWFQYIIHKHPSAHIYTFDDGAVNLIPSGQFHAKEVLDMRHRVAYFLLRRYKDQDWIKPRIIKHFTIYEDKPNIVEPQRLQFIDLLDTGERASKRTVERKVKVFLGFDLSPNYAASVRAIGPDIYLPHPMEKSVEWSGKVESTELIAEEYLIRLLDRFNSIEVYACNSSVLLNLKSSRIKKIVVDLYGSSSVRQQEYNELAERMGCEIVSFGQPE